MHKIKLNEKTIKTATYVIAILFAIVFAIYPETNSIFIKNNDKSLVYKSNLADKTLSDVELGVALNENDSTIDTMRLNLTIARDQKYKDENEYYIIEGFSSLSNNETVVCKVVPNSKDPNLDVVKETVDRNTIYKISFNNTSSTIPEVGTIDIECDVTKNIAQKENIEVLVKVYEAIGEEARFIYQSKVFGPMDYKRYEELFQTSDPGKTIYFEDKDGNELDDEHVYLAFMAIMRDHYVNINEFAKTYNMPLYFFEDYINDYGTLDVNDIGIKKDNAKTMLLGDTFTPLLGITRYPVKDSEGNSIVGYSFDFEENLAGYVKSYKFYKSYTSDINSKKRVYFSSTKSNDISLALQKTLSNYIYPDEDVININGISYTKAELIYEYVNEYIVKQKDGVYSCENLAGLPEITYITSDRLEASGLTDVYPYINFDYITLDVAYNHFSKESGIRVSHYTDKADITYVFEEAIKIYDTDLQGALKTAIGSTTTNLYKAITCTENCSSYTEELSVGDNTYIVKVEPNVDHNLITIEEGNIKINIDTNDKMIAEFNTKLNNLTSTSKYNDVKTIMKNNISDVNSDFYKAIISETATANDTEIYYVNGKIYSITVKHNGTNNEIVVEKEENLKTAIDKINNSTLPSSLQTAINNNDSTLVKAVMCITNCSNYNDIYYDGTNYNAVKVTNKGTYNKIDVVVSDDFELMMEKTYNTSVAASLVASYSTGAYIYSAVTEMPQTGANYLEIHYDSVNNEYLLFNIAHTDDCNIISSYVLMTKDSNKTDVMNKTMNLLKGEYNNGTEYVYFHTKYFEDGSNANIIYLERELTEYLQQYLIIDIDDIDTSDPDYTRGGFLIEGVKTD